MLARLEAFLPELKRANETLDPAQASIENQVDEDEDSSSEDESMQGHRDHCDDLEQRYIEMVRTSFAPLFQGISLAILMFWRVIFFLFYFSFHGFFPFSDGAAKRIWMACHKKKGKK